ncbi:ABC transporter permease [Leadbettera azotonutricia]|uniref:Autoinducer 2 import system permease protein LsrD n=1 Tax=Leadbettera azotonutricia (strain ATCC BAA-888 / DSM 13862 / ZAS-9) TaxID=545695 RepID=F5YG49_LEAAZ|nr:ABC transporter permease [Leadbettera azotonutricia]AEF82417.1 ribose transport system permease protein RbsC [Leadbettera azotonutricia ZAS-9]
MDNEQKSKFKFTFNWILAAILVILFITISAINSVFLSFGYLAGIMLRNIVEIGLLALPGTLIVITGGIDLSMGSTLVLSAMVGGMAAVTFGSAGGIIATLLTGAGCGLFNGFLIAKIKISPMVTTLATMYLFMGLARSLSKGDSVYTYPASQAMGTTYIGGSFPLQIVFYIVLAFIFWFILSKTILGRSLFGIGLNENATYYSGVNTDRVKMITYLLSGLMCAFASIVWLGRFTSIKYDAGTSLGLKVVTVIVLGGTSILGGVGDMKSTILATFIIAVLNSGLTVLNIPITTQTIVHGMILVISLISYSVLNDKAGRAISAPKKLVSRGTAA